MSCQVIVVCRMLLRPSQQVKMLAGTNWYRLSNTQRKYKTEDLATILSVAVSSIFNHGPTAKERGSKFNRPAWSKLRLVSPANRISRMAWKVFILWFPKIRLWISPAALLLRWPDSRVPEKIQKLITVCHATTTGQHPPCPKLQEMTNVANTLRNISKIFWYYKHIINI